MTYLRVVIQHRPEGGAIREIEATLSVPDNVPFRAEMGAVLDVAVEQLEAHLVEAGIIPPLAPQVSQ